MVRRVGESTAQALTAERQEREQDNADTLERLRQLHDAQEHGVAASAAATSKLSETVSADLRLVEERAVKQAAQLAQPEYEHLARAVRESADASRMQTDALVQRIEAAERCTGEIGRQIQGWREETIKYGPAIEQCTTRKDLQEAEASQASTVREALAEVSSKSSLSSCTV